MGQPGGLRLEAWLASPRGSGCAGVILLCWGVTSGQKQFNAWASSALAVKVNQDSTSSTFNQRGKGGLCSALAEPAQPREGGRAAWLLGARMEPGRGSSAPAPAGSPAAVMSSHFPNCLQGWERSPRLLLPAWAGGPWGQCHDLEMLAQGSARGYAMKGLGKEQGHGEMRLEAERTGMAREMGGEKPLLRAPTPPAKSCYRGQQAINQARVPFHHPRYLGRAVPFPTASAKPGMGHLSVARRWKAVNLYSFPA